MNILTLNQILKDCRHLKRLILREARIDVNGKVDFGTNLDYHIEYLSLAYSGRDDHSDWNMQGSNIQYDSLNLPQSRLSHSHQF